MLIGSDTETALNYKLSLCVEEQLNGFSWQCMWKVERLVVWKTSIISRSENSQNHDCGYSQRKKKVVYHSRSRSSDSASGDWAYEQGTMSRWYILKKMVPAWMQYCPGHLVKVFESCKTSHSCSRALSLTMYVQSWSNTYSILTTRGSHFHSNYRVKPPFCWALQGICTLFPQIYELVNKLCLF